MVSSRPVLQTRQASLEQYLNDMKLFKRFIFLQEKKEALVTLTITSLIWGVSAPIMKLALLMAPVYLVAFLRFYGASFLIFLLKPNLYIAKKDIPRLFLAAFVGVTLHIPIFFYGLKLTSVMNAAILSAGTPVITLIFATVFLKEKVKKNLVYGCLFGMIGMLVVFLAPLVTEGVSVSIFGNLLLFTATFTWLLYEIICKDLTKRYAPSTITFYTFFIGSLTLFPFALPSLLNEFPILLQNIHFVFYITFGILFTSAIAFYCWMWGLSKLEVSRVGFFVYLDPVIATAAAFFMLKETITIPFLLGAAFIFFGLYIAETTIHWPHFHLTGHKGKQN